LYKTPTVWFTLSILKLELALAEVMLKEAKARTAIAKAKMMNAATVFFTLFSSDQTNTHVRLVFIDALIYLLLEVDQSGHVYN
jgi:hypothetical protein